MDALLKLDWEQMLWPSTSLLEVAVRGTVTYLAIFTLLRLVLKRQASGFAMTDVLVIVLIADAAQNGMAGEYRSITEGIVLVATIVGWSYALDWLGYKVPAFERLLQHPPLQLVESGRMLRANMRKELITYDDLLQALREEGISELKDVEAAYMEADGRISVIKREGA